MRDDALLRLVVVAAYGLGALLSFAASRKATGREHRAWLGAGVILALLATGKLLNVQDEVTGLARSAAKFVGWYEFHREAQAIFALVIVLAAIGLGQMLARWLRDCGIEARAAAAAIFALILFLAIRAASIHDMDAWTTSHFAGMRRGWWVELAASAAVCVAAARRLRRGAG